MSNLDLEIKKALNNKIDLDKFMLFTVKVDSETKIDVRVNKNTIPKRNSRISKGRARKTKNI